MIFNLCPIHELFDHLLDILMFTHVVYRLITELSTESVGNFGCEKVSEKLPLKIYFSHSKVIILIAL